MKTVCLLYGGNIGESDYFFERATGILKNVIGNSTVSSSVYVSDAWGFTSDNKFLNKLVLFETDLSAEDVLTTCLETEEFLGRLRSSMPGYSDRLIDIDVLYMEDIIINTKQLILPHPRLQDRLFALVPLCEVIPEFIHPVLQKSNKSLLSLCNDKSKVEKLK